MKVPLSWLREYVHAEFSAEDLRDKLTFSGIEVEGIEIIGSEFNGIVAGRILEWTPHPDADRLRVCKVDAGGDVQVNVVCGADNFEVGDVAALAMIGASLPGGMTIRKAKIRGHVSEGMLCAEDELGLSDDHGGILLLEKSVLPGTPLAQVLGPPETVMDLEITWNRSDCLSIIGIAREVAALYQAPMCFPQVELIESATPVQDCVRVSIEDPEGCPRYTARVLQNVTPCPSPQWLQQRLVWCGIRPINCLVDVTNYVMLECGHPLHAFDLSLLEHQQIVVRRAKKGESIVTLDGVPRSLSEQMLVIADSERPVALAGIMGGAGSEIGDNTQNVLLESASFDPAGIHQTSVTAGLGTESSHRFERGVDPETVEWASRRAAGLMQQFAGGTLLQGGVDAYPRKHKPVHITYHYAEADQLLGFSVPPQEVQTIFSRLEIQVQESLQDACKVQVPSFRTDLQRQADLIEEVARMAGLHRVPSSVPVARVVPNADDARPRCRQALRERLTALGLYEVMHYSFLAPDLIKSWDENTAAACVGLPDPVSMESSLLRPSLLPQMLETLGRNQARQLNQAACFEIGKTFARRQQRIEEEEWVSIGMFGPVGRVTASRQPVSIDDAFFWGKGVVEEILRVQHVAPVQWKPLEFSCFLEGTGVSLAQGTTVIGQIGMVHPRITRRWRFSSPVFLAELRVDCLLANVERKVRVLPVSLYPSICRDFAIVVAESVLHQNVLNVVERVAPTELTSVQLFDIFRDDEGIGRGKKSMAYSLTYQAKNKTLTDDEANALHEAVKNALRRELNAEIREN